MRAVDRTARPSGRASRSARRALVATAALLIPSVALADEADPSPGWVAREAAPAVRAYGERGSVEVGVATGAMLASHLSATVAPSIGWFLADNTEVSAIAAMTHVVAGARSSTYGTLLVEPSYHYALADQTFAFAGLGFGVGYVDKVGAGLAFAPRVGVNVRVGTTGILTPSLSLEYMTHGIGSTTVATQMDASSVEVPNALRLNLGYSQLW